MGNDILHIGMELFVCQSLLQRTLHHGACHRMREMFLQACRLPQHFIFGFSTERNHTDNRRFCLCDRSRLIKHDRIRLRNRLQKLSALYGNVIIRRFLNGRQYRDRHCHLKRTGVIHHKDRHGFGHIAADRPRQAGSKKRIRHQPVSKPLRVAFQRGFHLFRFFDHLYDLIKSSAAFRLCHTDRQFTFFHYGSGKHAHPGTFMYRNGFAGHGRLVDHCLTRIHFPVERDHIAHAYHDTVTALDP